ncbi:MAG: ThuA domain-containing protein [Armatimonadetes bacterium]|nr:ThuA domain-containing protein [Armatimonadota bacterium]
MEKVLYFTRHTVYTLDPAERRPKLPRPLVPLEDGLSFSDKVMIEIGKRAGVQVDCSRNGEVFDGDLDQYAAFVFWTSGSAAQLLGPASTQGTPPISERGQQRLFDALDAGKGLVAIRNTVSFHTEDLFGCSYNGHGPQQECAMIVKDPDFPAVKGIGESFRITDSWYTFKNFQDDLHVVLAQGTNPPPPPGATPVSPPEPRPGSLDRPPYPAAWARQHGKRRLFYTTMGNLEQTWQDPVFQGIIQRAIPWAKGDVEADVTPDIREVTPQANQLHW